MRIAVDVKSLMDRPTGIGRFTAQLIDSWQRVRDTTMVLYAFGGQRPSPALAELAGRPSTELLHHPLPMRVVRRLWQLSRRPLLESITGDVDLVLAAETTMPACRAPVVAVVHDLVWRDHPEWFNAYVRRAAPENLRDVVERAALILCNSSATLSSLSAAAPEAAARAHVVHPSFDARQVTPTTGSDPSVLFVGTREPRKGLAPLARALLDARGPAAALRLTVVGASGWGAVDDDDALRALRSLGRADLMGYLPDRHVSHLRARARLAAVPSLAEGFGLPLLESLAAGTPTVASDIPVFHEVGDDAFASFLPNDPHSLREQIEHLARSADERRRLHLAGIERATAFTPDRQAAALDLALQGIA